MSDITLPSRLDDVELVKSIRTPASLTYQYMPGYEPSRFLQGVAQKKLIGLRCPEVREGLRAGSRVLPDRRHRHQRAGRAVRPRNRHLVLRRERAVLRPGHGAALRECPDPARRLGHPDHAPHPGDRRQPRAHGPARSRRSGSPTARSARPSNRSSTSDRPASPTPTGRPTRTTSDERHRDHLARSDRPHPPHRRQRRSRC